MPDTGRPRARTADSYVDAVPTDRHPNTSDPLVQRTRLVAASYLALRRDNQVLLHLRAGTGYLDGHWALLAGHVDPGESALDAAVREAREEGGVVVDPSDIEPLTTLHRFEPGGPALEQRVDFFFTTWHWTGEPTVREPHRAEAMRWFTLDDLPDPVVPHERLVLEQLSRSAKKPPSPSESTGSTLPAILVVRP